MQSGGIFLCGDDGASSCSGAYGFDVFGRKVVMIREAHHIKVGQKLAQVVYHLLGRSDACYQQWILAHIVKVIGVSECGEEHFLPMLEVEASYNATTFHRCNVAWAFGDDDDVSAHPP